MYQLLLMKQANLFNLNLRMKVQRRHNKTLISRLKLRLANRQKMG